MEALKWSCYGEVEGDQGYVTLMSQPNCMIKVRLLSCHNKNRRQPQTKWKMASTNKEDNLTQNGR